MAANRVADSRCNKAIYKIGRYYNRPVNFKSFSLTPALSKGKERE